MKNLNVEVKNFRKSNSIGTLEWTINEIEKMNIGIHVLKTGKLSIATTNDDGKLIQVIAKEGEDERYEGVRYFKEDKEGVFCWDFSTNGTTPISYCYAIEQDEVIDYENQRTFDPESLFGDILTPAAVKLVDDFIEECCFMLIKEIFNRDKEEFSKKYEIKIS